MRYFICANDDQSSKEASKRIKNFLDDYAEFLLDEKNPELVISIGGDGRFLKSIKKYHDKMNSFAIVGIATGKLGFLCDYRINELEDFLQALVSKTPKYESRKLLEVEYNKKKYLFLNEFRLEKIFETINIDIYINDIYFTSFKGNGLNFSTATGSTAYNKSLNGPLINPRQNVIIMQEIAPINNSLQQNLNSPLVFFDRDVVTLKGLEKNIIFGGDNEYSVFDNIHEEIRIMLSLQSITFAHYKPYDYYQKIKRSFLERS